MAGYIPIMKMVVIAGSSAVAIVGIDRGAPGVVEASILNAPKHLWPEHVTVLFPYLYRGQHTVPYFFSVFFKSDPICPVLLL